MKAFKGSLLALVFCVVSAFCVVGPCQYITPSNQYFYDLSPLSVCDGAGYEITDQSTNITVNFCASLQVSNCFPGAGVCLSTFFNTSSLGNSQSISFSPFSVENQGVVLTYSSGDVCSENNDARYSSVLQIACAEDVHPPEIYFVGENPQCVYNFKVLSRFACPIQPTPQNQTCKPIVPLNVFVVPHSHDDYGWIMTPEQYYDLEVRNILTTVQQNLMEEPYRKFIQVEQGYFYMWWHDPLTTNEMKQNIFTLLENKQLEFVLGGFVMNDEAVTTYLGDIDQLTLGHTFLKETFNVAPTMGWQIDPFGASSATPTFQQMAGFTDHVIDRINFRLKNQLKAERMLEFLWKSSDLLGEETFVFTHILDDNYCNPMNDGFNFENPDHFKDPPITPSDLEARSDAFAQQAYMRLGYVRTPNILLPYGCDFHYQNATEDFPSFDLIVEFINAHPHKYNMNIKYALLSEYFESVRNYSYVEMPVIQGDFFPYDDNYDAWWTGYYTSRPQLKLFARYAEATLRASEFILTNSIARDSQNYYNYTEAFEGINTLRFAVAGVQHHDAITGTEKNYVATAYATNISAGEFFSNKISTTLLQNLANLGNGAPSLTLTPNNLNEISVGDTVAIMVYNSLGWTRNDFIRVPINGSDGNYVVTDSNGMTVPSQINPAFIVPNSTPPFSRYLHIQVNLPPLGFETYYITRSSLDNENENVPKVVEWEHEQSKNFTNDFLTIFFERNGTIASILNHRSNITVQFTQNFLMYDSYTGFDGQYSGAYIFHPNGPANLITNENPTTYIVTGDYVTEIYQEFSSTYTTNSFAQQIVRIYSCDDIFVGDFIEIEHSIGPLPTLGNGREFITRLSTSLNNDRILYTDDNGYEFLQRTYTPNLITPIPGNYYPTVYSSFIQDQKLPLQLSLVSDSSHGVSSLNNGDIEYMLHRRLLQDDGRGVNEALNDSTTVYPKLRLIFDTPSISYQLIYRQTQLLNFPPVIYYSNGTVIPKVFNQSYRTSYTPLNGQLPPNIHLLSAKIYSVKSLNAFILRFYHMFGVGEDEIYSVPTTINISQLFEDIQIQSFVETTLTANQALNSATKEVLMSELESDWIITLLPKQIRTFLITLA